jgi:tRNA A-37 threonylcarbamoyl transferase component Bud32
LLGQPTKIGKYEVVDLIGRGGMGVVYKARDPQLDRLVAIKMIIGANPALLKRFDVEARSTAGLQHQNIVTIYDFGSQDGNPYLVMEYLEGSSLESIISSERSLSLASKLGICIAICNGLNYAHDRGIIHRDVKPANVMVLKDDTVKIVDFGIARIGDTGISRTEVVGSLNYMSPEQFQSTPLDIRTDIFSTGVLLYRLLTGTLPFQAAGEAAVMYRIIHDAPLPIGSYVQGYPAELDSIVSKALAKNRENRYGSCRDLAFDLQFLRQQQKHTDAAEWLQRAETAIQKTEWTKAEDCLKQLLKIEEHNSKAYQMLGEVQERVRRQRRADQSRQLRTQADEALLDRRYDDALSILSQAIDVDATNQELVRLRESVQEAKSRASRLHQALRRAEGAQQAGDLDEAKRAVSEALELDPEETSAKALRFVIFKQVEERDRQLKMRKLLDDAREQLAARDLTRAMETLSAAEKIDPASVELGSLLKVANSAREQQLRKAELEKLSRQIEEALAREDYEGASAIANDGLRRYPQEPGLLKLKALSEAEQKRIKLIAYARERLVAANGLLEAGKTLEALAVLERALQEVPGQSQLESLRADIKNRLTLEDAEVHKRSLLERAQEALRRKEFREGIRLLEAAQSEFPGRTEIEDLLRTSRKLQAREKLVGEVLSFAQQLSAQKGPQAAAEYLEEQVPFVTDDRVGAALKEARHQAQQFRQRIQNAVEEGKRILREHGSQETRKFLEAQPQQFLESAEFQGLAELLRKHEACESLDRELAKQSDLDAQVRMAEEAIRRNPGNEEINARLASLLQLKQAVQGIVDRAGGLEGARHYGEAAQQLSLLRKLYPRYPNLDREIQRLQRLEEQQKSLAGKSVVPGVIDRTIVAEQIVGKAPALGVGPPGGVQATRMMGASAAESEAAAATLPRPAAVDGTLRPAPVVGGLSRAQWLGIGAAVLVLVVAGIVWELASPGGVGVHIQTIPADAIVRVDGKVCQSPCAPRLSVGAHTVGAERTGYVNFGGKIDVARGGQNEFEIPLTAEATPGTTVVSTGVETKVEEKGPKNTATGQYLIVQGPAGAQVAVDQHSPESIPSVGRLSVAVAPGPHNVEVKMDGYGVWQRTVQVPTGARLPLLADLKAIPNPTLNSNSHNPANGSTNVPAIVAPTATMTISPDTVDKGQSADLHWDTKGATDITIDGQKVQPQGTMKIAPTESGNHYLVAHGPGGDAKDVAHLEVRTPAPVTPPAQSEDQSGIQRLLDSYVIAFQAKDRRQLRHIWPSMSDKNFKDMQNNFKDAESIRLTLHKNGPAQVNGSAGTVTCVQDTEIKVGGQVQSSSYTATFYLTKLPDGWVFDRIEYQKISH